jgi:uncharacterized protein
MVSKPTPDVFSQVFGIIIFAIVMAIILAIAKSKGFFNLPFSQTRKATITNKMLFTAFFTYIIINALLTPLIIKFLSFFFQKMNGPKDIFTISLMNVLNNGLIILSLFFVSLFFLKNQFKNIWKEDSTSTYWADIRLAIISWLIALPTVMFTGNLTELLLKFFVKNPSTPDQVAIEYVKLAARNPLHFVIALISILIFAPLIEEFLFRGLLQNYLRKYLGVTKAILLTSALFALFHFASSQGLSNVIIILSLFILALFLGFIYEKQKSLLSPIVLHALFNATNTFNLLFFKDL